MIIYPLPKNHKNLSVEILNFRCGCHHYANAPLIPKIMAQWSVLAVFSP